MVSKKEVERQLKKINFNLHGWGRSEARELPNVLVNDEEIYEVVNGMYEGGFALLVATNIRVLLIDRKPLNYLTVEDLRFDMINEIDYSHRLVGAHISISTGSKNLKFRSYNQPRLRKLITHVQHCMAEDKQKESNHQEGQNSHLEQINQQLQTYLVAQHQQQQKLQERLEQANTQQSQAPASIPEPVRPSPELADFLFAQSLLAEHKAKQGQASAEPAALKAPETETPSAVAPVTAESNQQQAFAQPAEPATPQLRANTSLDNGSQMAELYADGMQEVFGSRLSAQQALAVDDSGVPSSTQHVGYKKIPAILPILPSLSVPNPLDINAINIAYSKLPMALRNRKFGRPSFHAHSQATLPVDTNTATPAQ